MLDNSRIKRTFKMQKCLENVSLKISIIRAEETKLHCQLMNSCIGCQMMCRRFKIFGLSDELFFELLIHFKNKHAVMIKKFTTCILTEHWEQMILLVLVRFTRKKGKYFYCLRCINPRIPVISTSSFLLISLTSSRISDFHWCSIWKKTWKTSSS